MHAPGHVRQQWSYSCTAPTTLHGCLGLCEAIFKSQYAISSCFSFLYLAVALKCYSHLFKWLKYRAVMISFPIYVVCKLLFLGCVCQFHGFTQQAEYTLPLWTVLWHQFSCFLVHWNSVQAMPNSAQHATDAVSWQYLASISLTVVVHNSIKSIQGRQRSPVWRSCFHAFLWHGSEDSFCPQ